MGIASWIVFGVIAGVLAKWIVQGKDSGGIHMTILLGTAGAIVSGMIGFSLGSGTVTGFDIGSVTMAIVDATLLLFGYQLVSNRTTV